MEIKKAIITAAGKTQRTLPLQALVDCDGQTKAALRILIEEILSAGIEEICIVVCPGDQAAYTAAAAGLGSRLRFVEQGTALGYGHAVFCAREFAGAKPFLLLVGDHLYVSGAQKRSAQQLVEMAAAENCAVSAVQATRESLLPYFGAVGGRRIQGRRDLYVVETVIEKPMPTEAELRLIVPGLRAGHYLCFFGMHVLTPTVMEILGEQVSAAGASGAVTLSAALAELAGRERYLALEQRAWRYDVGVRYGILNAQLALALSGKDRAEVLSLVLDLLAQRDLGATRGQR